MDQCFKLAGCYVPSRRTFQCEVHVRKIRVSSSKFFAPQFCLSTPLSSRSSSVSLAFDAGKSWDLSRFGNWQIKNKSVAGMLLLTCNYSNVREHGTEGENSKTDITKGFKAPAGLKLKIDPVAIIKGLDPLIARPLAIFLRDRYKNFKTLKERIACEDENLPEFASGYEVFGIRRHCRHGVELYEWAPGAFFFSIIGDFNNWAHREHYIEDGYLGRDAYNHLRIFVEDELRDGEEEDDMMQEYNYMSDFDKGDEDVDMDAIFQKMNDDYWEPGEDEFMHKSPQDLVEEIYNEVFKGSANSEEEEEDEDEEDEDEEDGDQEDEDDGPEWEETDDPEVLIKHFGGSKEDLDAVQREEEVKTNEIPIQNPETSQVKKMETKKRKTKAKRVIEDARTRYEKYKASPEYNDYGLPPIDIIDDGKSRHELEIVNDPVWRARVFAKKPPLAYWEYFVKGRKAWEKKYIPCIPHLGRFREYLHTPEGPMERIPAWASYVLPGDDGKYSAIFWDPPPEGRHKWVNTSPGKPDALRIYECHVGISGEDPQIASFKDFTSKVLPHVRTAGYNAIQLIGVQEHVDYSSVGYKVTNMFAVSSRFGTPEDFKLLVDMAHGMGLLVFLDIVHSYAAPDEMVGLAAFDGANDCYFYPGKRGQHKRWGTRMFRYGEYEVLRYLLSNLKWWVVEYQIDGFHFHSLSSMLYTHNGFSDFANGVQDYCNQYVDMDAQIYLLLANELLHQLNPNIITIAEDVTMYPGISQPLSQGGLGFDYHVNLEASEMWAQLLESVPDENWSMRKIVATLKADESRGKTLIYAENHNQSIVGGKSLAEMLLNGSRIDMGASSDLVTFNGQEFGERQSSMRGMSLLKMIKLLTLSLGGSAYLNFMGNEFGHPDRVEFPRSSNRYSYARARRQWNLLHNAQHSQLAIFDRVLMELEEDHKILSSGAVTLCHVDDTTKVIIYIRGRLLFAFNFHPSNFYDIYKVGVPEAGEYKRIMDTGEEKFGGYGELKAIATTPTTSRGRMDNFNNILILQLPSRSAQVYQLGKVWDSNM